MLTGDQLVPGAAQVSFDPTTGAPEVILQFKRDGARAFEIVSGRNVGRKLGIFLDGVAVSTPVIPGGSMAPGQPLSGPAVIVQPNTTLWVAPENTVEADAYGNLVLTKKGAKP